MGQKLVALMTTTEIKKNAKCSKNFHTNLFFSFFFVKFSVFYLLKNITNFEAIKQALQILCIMYFKKFLRSIDSIKKLTENLEIKIRFKVCIKNKKI